MPQRTPAPPVDSQPATITMPPVHEAAELFPLIDGQPFEDLIANIKRYGLRDPIVRTNDGKILDGRNRYRACLAAGVEPEFRTWRGPGTALQYVVSVNLHRRHLTTSQRAMIAAKIATLDQGARTDLASKEAMSQPQAADALKVSRASVQRAKEIIDKGTPELVEAVRDGAISVVAASAATTLEPEAQRDVVRRVKKGAKPSTVVPKKKKTPKSEPEIEGPGEPEMQELLEELRHEVEWFIKMTAQPLEEISERCTNGEFDEVRETLRDLGGTVRALGDHFDHVIDVELVDRLFDGHFPCEDPAPKQKKRKK